MSWVDRDRVVECLRELSDRALQEQLWRNVGPAMRSFEEAACGLFDDSGLDMCLDKGEVAFSEDVDALLRHLSTKLRAFDRAKAPLDIANEPKLDEIRSLAKQILSLIT